MTEIKRYEMNHRGLPSADHTGTWVLHEDHAAIVAEKDARIAALQEQVRGLKERLQLVAELNDVASALHVEAEKKVWALAAEGSAIKQAFKQAANTVEEYEIYGDLKYAVEPSEYEALADAIEETPNTEAALREIRAKVLDDMADDCEPVYLEGYILELRNRAASIRAGEQP